MFWLGIQGANGAQCITIMLTAIWPSYGKIPNHIATNQGITTQGMIRLVVSPGWLKSPDQI
jgi:NCS1 family nucleobase:cation symporter-1